MQRTGDQLSERSFSSSFTIVHVSRLQYPGALPEYAAEIRRQVDLEERQRATRLPRQQLREDFRTCFVRPPSFHDASVEVDYPVLRNTVPLIRVAFVVSVRTGC